jgi:hypothetical protein
MPSATEYLDSETETEADQKPDYSKLSAKKFLSDVEPSKVSRPLAGKIADVASKVIGEPSGLGVAGWTQAVSHPIITVARPALPKDFDETKPLINLPTPGPKANPILGGAADFAKSLAAGLSTPDVLEQLALGGTSKMAAKVVSIPFLEQMATDAPDAAADVGKKLGEGDKRGATEALLRYAADVVPTGEVVRETAPPVTKADKAITLARAIGNERPTASPLAITPQTRSASEFLSEPEIPVKKGEENASNITSATRVPEPEIRPPVGEETPLRQQGQVAGTPPPEQVGPRQESLGSPRPATPEVKPVEATPTPEATPAVAPQAEKGGQAAAKPSIRENAKAFDQLVLDNAIPAKFTQNPDALYTPTEGSHALGTIGIKGKIAQNKAMIAARRQAAKDIGLDPDRIGEPAYRAQALDKLKEHVAKVSAPTPEMPKLRPMEEQGDLMANQTEDFALAQEHGTDYAKVQAQKEAAEAARAESDKAQGIIGMGGAIPSEFEGGSGTATSIKNAVVEQERAKRGLPPAIQPVRDEHPEVWDRAMAHIDQDPAWQDNLIGELRDHPRAITPEENAALLARQVELQNTHDKVTRDLAQLYKDNTEALIPAYQAQIGVLRDQLFDLYQIDKRVGTASGRSLAARKMMADEDLNLVKMEIETRAAKGGRPLTESETAQVQRLHDEIKGWQAKYDAHVAATREREANLEAQLATERIKKMPPETKPLEPGIKRIVDRIQSLSHTQADLARARIAARRGRVSAGIDPTELADYAIIGADHILTGAVNVAEWSTKMIGEFGEGIRDHLDAIYKASNKAADELIDRTALNKARAAQSAIKQMSPAQKVDYLKEKIGEKIKGKKNDQITNLVQRLARAFVDQKPTIERDELIDSVHGLLQEIDPNIDRSTARDMISGYGDFKQLSKDAISKRLRDLKGQMQQVAKLEDMQQGQPPLKTGVERRTPSIEESRLIKLVNEAKREFQVPITDPNTQLKSSLDTLKARMQSKTMEYEDRLKAGDFNPRPKREIKLDAEALRLKGNLEKARQKFYDGLVSDRLKNRSTFEKAADTLVKWSRGFLLSGPSTLAKLTAAAFWRMVQNPIEETVGAGIGMIPGIRQIAERAPVEGGLNVRAEAKAITEGFTKGLDDAANTIKTGKSVLDRVFGGPRDVGIGEETEAQKSVIDFFGHLHGALKAPVKRAAFARAFEKLTAFNLKNGVDVSDPLVQTRMAIQAYKRANMDIFMQPNRYATAMRMGLRGIEAKSKTTGQTPVSGKLAATAVRTLIPIVKVPTNIVAEALQYATGLVTGSARAAMAIRKGVENIKPEEADLIMRELKKGSIGTALLLVGYFNPGMFGGFYQQGEKRKPGETPYGGAKVDGHQIPRQLLHTPAIEVAQTGATVRRVAESRLRKGDMKKGTPPSPKQGLASGALAGALGLADDVPFIGDMLETSKLFDPHQRDQWIAELAKSRLVPQMLSQVAEHYDTNAAGQPVKRKEQNPIQGIKAGIPGLRETLPVKP